MIVAKKYIILGAMMGCWISLQVAAQPSERPNHGSLQRVAAALENTLNLYRLMLQEVVPAASLMAAQGRQRGALPNAPVPPLVHEVFARMARSIENRAPKDALPPLAKRYHAELVDALDMLVAAENLGGLVPHLRRLYDGAQAMGRMGHQVAQLFAKQQPVSTQVLDPDATLEAISESFDELAMAEKRILELRKRGAALGEQLGAFMRLEIALGRTLDLIAMAEESGIHIGFDVQPPVGNLSWLVEMVQRRLHQLEPLLADMERAPAEGVLHFAAAVQDAQNDMRRATVRWELENGGSAALVRLYRKVDPQRREAVLLPLLRCAGLTLDQARRRLEETRRSTPEHWERVGDVPAGRRQFVDEYSAARHLEPGLVYKLVPVSSFGVEGQAVQTTAQSLESPLAAPGPVVATPFMPEVWDADFYRNHDAVRVEFAPSPQDARGDPFARELLMDLQVAIVREYRIFRITGEQPRLVASIPAGVTTWVDRVPAHKLQQGVSYVVEAVAEQGAARSPGPRCKEPVQHHAILQAVKLARLGAGSVVSRRRMEAALRETMHPMPGEFGARETLESINEDMQRGIVAHWWQEQSLELRERWLQRWPELLGSQAEAVLAQSPQIWHRDDLQGAVLQLWMEAHPDFPRSEIERFWRLEGPQRAEQTLADWKQRLSPGARAWIQQRLGGGDTAVMWPAQVLGWWHSRDMQEQQVVEHWWQEQPQEKQREQLQDWLAGLEPVQRSAVLWPAWEGREREQREAFLREPPTQLPLELQQRFLAWFVLESSPSVAQAEWVSKEAGPLGRVLARARYGLRPIDKAMGFALPWAVLLAIVLLVTAFAMRQRQAVAWNVLCWGSVGTVVVGALLSLWVV